MTINNPRHIIEIKDRISYAGEIQYVIVNFVNTSI